MSNAVTLRGFQSGDEAVFRRLNEEWISRFFVLEPKDIAAFADPQHTILDKGGSIVIALQNGEAIGCCALVFMAPGVFEVAKMAVTASAQGSAQAANSSPTSSIKRAPPEPRASTSKLTASSPPPSGSTNRSASSTFRLSASLLRLMTAPIFIWN